MYLNPGDIIGEHYRIDSPLGSGGFGSTYLAEDSHLPNNPKCVVKQIIPQSNDPSVLYDAKERFNREAKALHDLGSHSQIPQLFEYFEQNRRFYLVQEFIEGHPLSEELTLGRQLKEGEVIDLLLGILEVLDFVHQKQIIHRDIKPSNLMRRKQDGKIVLIDFGAVKEISTLKVTSPGHVTSTAIIGTPGFMPAEQSTGQPKCASDVYAVGMIGIQAITGLNPRNLSTDRNTCEIIWRYEIPGQPMVQVSDKLATVLTKMVRYHFSERYSSAGDALKALAQLKPVPPKPPSSTWELLPQVAFTGSASWLIAIACASFLEKPLISSGLWMIILGCLIFVIFNRSRSVQEMIYLFIIPGIATGINFIFSDQVGIFQLGSQELVDVVLRTIIAGLLAFALMASFKLFKLLYG